MPITEELLPRAEDAGKTGRASMNCCARKTLLKTGALQTAILTSANFSIIATDEKGIIQLFNVGAERMLGYSPPKSSTRSAPATSTIRRK
jgi:sensor histidine kinase regulating citrate/malate metabolism